MKILNILIIVFIIGIIYAIRILLSKRVLLAVTSGQTETIIPMSKFGINSNSAESSYSMWFNVNEWSTNEKILFYQIPFVNNKDYNSALIKNNIIQLNILGISGEMRCSLSGATSDGGTGFKDCDVIESIRGISAGVTANVKSFVGYTGEYILMVALDKYINNLEIYTQNINPEYDKKTNCGVYAPGQFLHSYEGLTNTQCKSSCASWNRGGFCKSYSFSSYQAPPPSNLLTLMAGTVAYTGNCGDGKELQKEGCTATIQWGSDYNVLKEQVSNIESHSKTADNGATGTCSLYSSTFSLPRECSQASFSFSDSDPYASYENNMYGYEDGTDVNVQKTPCVVNSIPIQRWVNLILVIEGDSITVYIDGKVVRVCSITNGFESPSDSLFIITPLTYGFNGSTYNFQYWNHSLTSSEIKKVSKKVF